MIAPPVSDTTVREACRILEAARGQEAHLEALLLLGGAVVGGDLDDQPDHWPEALVEVARDIRHVGGNSGNNKATATSFPPPGQFGKAVENQVVACVIQSAAAQAAHVQSSRSSQGPILDGLVQEMRRRSMAAPDPHPFLSLLDARVSEIRSYHARHGTNAHFPKARRLAADGFDIGARAWWRPLTHDTLYTTPEVWGKYLDLEQSEWMRTLQLVQQNDTDATPTNNSNNSFVYSDFLQVLVQGLDKLDGAAKVTHRKLYERFLVQLQDYLISFLKRTTPLLNVHQEILAPALRTVDAKGSPLAAVTPVDLTDFTSVEALQKAVTSQAIKAELGRLGLKCGGTPVDRAVRLWLTKGKAAADWPAKIRAKQSLPATTNTSRSESGTVDAAAATAASAVSISLVQREALVTALLDQVRPSLEATSKRMERQQGQTLSEREKEIQEDLHGSTVQAKKRKAVDGYEDDDDEDDAPIYNPKNVPLDWDGRPIPYWLFKLHGLNHVSTIRNEWCVCLRRLAGMDLIFVSFFFALQYYTCEICSGESYRGRRNFELHFADQKHSAGMKSLGIPNTKHFHGVTNIQDAQDLWGSLQEKLKEDQFDVSKEEEYEDSNGNVLSRTTYEDLARQGLL
jgi:splicing factor 3A subunit 3